MNWLHSISRIVKKIRVSVVFFILLTGTASVPLLHIFTMLLNSAVLFFIRAFGKYETEAMYIADTLLAMYFVYLFYRSSKAWHKILTGFGMTVFLLPCLVYGSEGTEISHDDYWLWYLLISAIVGSPLILADIIKYFLQKRQQRIVANSQS